MQSELWLFPVIFMLHEMEEIIGAKIWLDKNTDIVRRYDRLSALHRNFSSEGFSAAVLEEYLLCIMVTGASIYFDSYIVWIGAFIAFSLHLLMHIVQSMVVKRYIPALASSVILLPISIFLIREAIYTFGYTFSGVVISAVLCTVLVALNVLFGHYIMKRVTFILRR